MLLIQVVGSVQNCCICIKFYVVKYRENQKTVFYWFCHFLFVIEKKADETYIT